MMQPLFPHSPPASGSYLRICGVTALLALVLGLLVLGTGGSSRGSTDPPAASAKEPTIDGLALFSQWPKAGQQVPDAAIVLTGQTFGFLQPCGCSHPQKGGLERRAQFINTLKAKGWKVAGVDLGDIYPEKDKVALRDQGLLRYKMTMYALREMGYIAVGVGKNEFAAEIDKVLGEYALQEQKRPFTLAGNVMGMAGGKPVPRTQHFRAPDGAPGAKRPLVELMEIAEVGTVPVGVVGIVGKSLAEEVEKEKLDPSITFEKNAAGKIDNAAILKQATNDLDNHPKKPKLNILLYQGTSNEAKQLAAAWPQFNVILCQADDSEPPQFPAIVNQQNGQKTLIIQVGHKGRYVGVLGAFRNGPGYDLYYQLVPLEEYYVTPGDENAARKANNILPILDNYAKHVKDFDFLGDTLKFRKLHNAQIVVQKPSPTYVGTAVCQTCHVAEEKAWKGTHHSHAMATLTNVPKRPSFRNYDPECVICHTVGFEYQTGYADEKKTPYLANVGCESCHGPGSAHVANPKNPKLLDLMSPWRAKSGDKLPLDLIKKLSETPDFERGKIGIPPAQQLMINLASGMCAKCHNVENDPHFDFPKNWLKVNHSGLAPAGGWPAVAPKNAPPNK